MPHVVPVRTSAAIVACIVVTIAVVAAACLHVAGPAAAQEAPKAPPPKPPAAPAPPADPVATDVAMLRKLVQDGQWKKGADLAKSLFTKYPDDLGLLARIGEVEADLRTCVWRLSRKDVPMSNIVGCGATKVDRTTRSAEFSFPDLANEPGWTDAGGVRVFQIPFEDATVTFSMWGWMTVTSTHYTAVPPPAVVLHYDSERNGGYALMCEFLPANETLRGGVTIPMRGTIRRWGDREKQLTKPGASVVLSADDKLAIECSERSGTLQLRCGKTVLAKTTDSIHRDGVIALAGLPEAMKLVRDVRITGRISATYLRRVENEYEDRREREWVRKSWRREDHVPAWVMQAEEEAMFRRTLLPRDAAEEHRVWFRERWDRILAGDPDTIKAVAGWIPKAPDITGRYVRALLSVHAGEHADAEAPLRALTEAEPGFGPGWALAALNAWRMGDRTRADEALGSAMERADYHPWTWEVAAARALDDGNFDAAQSALDSAVRHRAGSPTLGALRTVLSRLRRGPDWTKRFRTESANYVVMSDHSTAVCSEVLAMLEEARSAYQTQFRKGPASDGRKARVYVFSGMASYLEYASESGTDASWTLGVYRPALRELLVFLHEDRRQLKDTVRHEGFHQYLHQFIEDPPIWFNEGTAEWFGYGRKKDGKHVAGQVGGSQLLEVAIYREDFIPLHELFRLTPREFMEDPGPSYVQSWAVIQFLRQTKDAKWKGLLDRYLDALLAGRSREQAYTDVMKPVVGDLERAIGTWLDTLQPK